MNPENGSFQSCSKMTLLWFTISSTLIKHVQRETYTHRQRDRTSLNSDRQQETDQHRQTDRQTQGRQTHRNKWETTSTWSGVWVSVRYVTLETTTDLYTKLPLTADLDARNWTKVISRHQSTHLTATHTRHALHRVHQPIYKYLIITSWTTSKCTNITCIWY